MFIFEKCSYEELQAIQRREDLLLSGWTLLEKEYIDVTEKVYDEIVEEARAEANLIIERAKVEIEREKEKAEYSLKKEAIDLALELSKKVIEKNIDEKKNRTLIDEFISEVGK